MRGSLREGPLKSCPDLDTLKTKMQRRKAGLMEVRDCVTHDAHRTREHGSVRSFWLVAWCGGRQAAAVCCHAAHTSMLYAAVLVLRLGAAVDRRQRCALRGRVGFVAWCGDRQGRSVPRRTLERAWYVRVDLVLRLCQAVDTQQCACRLSVSTTVCERNE